MSVREERIRPLSVIFIYSVFSLLIYGFIGGPGALVTLGYLCLALTGLWILVSLYWKISGHCAAMGALGAMVFAYPHENLVFVLPPLALLVAWSRIRLGCHSPAQTLAGTGPRYRGFLVFPFLIFPQDSYFLREKRSRSPFRSASSMGEPLGLPELLFAPVALGEGEYGFRYVGNDVPVGFGLRRGKGYPPLERAVKVLAHPVEHLEAHPLKRHRV